VDRLPDGRRSSAIGILANSATSEELILNEIILLLGMFACGAAVGALSRWGPLSAWGALVFPLFLPPVSIGLMMAFC
jgi:hypothetical protein